MRREIMNNIFDEIKNKDPVYGIKFQNNRYEIGNKEINLNYDKPNEEVIIHSDGRDYKFTVIGFIELFGTDKAPKISNIKNTDYINYGNLLKVTGFNTNNIDPNTDKIKKNLLVPLLRIMNYNYSIKRKNTELEKEFDKIRNYRGMGINTKVSSELVIIPSSIKDMKDKLTLILASMKAGNNSNDMKNEASALIDSLKKKKGITSKQEKLLLLNLFS
jgi:hypothetical protein